MLRDTRARSWSRRAAVAAGVGVLAAALVAAPASADTYDNDGFESFPLGTPARFITPGPQNCVDFDGTWTRDTTNWTSHDPNGWCAAKFDIAIVDPTSGPWGTAFGNRALQMSNAVYSGGFGNQLLSPALLNEAGETAAHNGGLSGGIRQSRMSGSITFASATQAYQDGLVVGFSLDKGDGTRMAYFLIQDLPAGLQVTYYYSVAPANYANVVIASGLSRTAPHTIEYSLDLVDGPNNDIMWIRMGDDMCGTWTESGSWENTHTVPNGSPPPAMVPGTWTVDSLLFRLATDPEYQTVPAYSGSRPSPKQLALLGNGLLFDDVTYTSSTVPPMPPVGTPGAPDEPDVQMNGATTTVTVPAVIANSCVPVTEYRVTLTPIPGGTPITYTSPTPTFTFPTPGVGNWDVTVAATNTEGTGDESLPAALTVVLAETDDDVIADTGPTEATWPTAGIAAALALLGIGLVTAARTRRVRA